MDMREEIQNIILIILGSLALALGVTLFLVPNSIATGGTPGMAILLHALTGLPVGSLMLLVNLALLAAGVKFLGKAFALRSVLAIVLSSFFIDLMAEILKVSALSNNALLATLYGGIAVGVGVGLILRGQASAGGTSIIARMISARSRFRSGQVILFFDAFIIAAAGIVFDDIERALWSFISIYVTAKCIDTILTGTLSEKVVHIVSNKADLLSRKIVDELGQQGTILSGTGLSPDEQKTIIFVTLEMRRIALLRDIIRTNDPDAFMVVMDAAELLGRGHGT